MTFTTVAEAEQAATMLRRFGGKESTVSGDFVAGARCWKIDPGAGQPYFWGWEQVADYLLARQEEAIAPARFGVVRGYLDTAHAIMASQTGNRDQAILALCEALGELLGVRG